MKKVLIFIVCFCCLTGGAQAAARKISTDGPVEVRGELGKVVDITFADGVSKLLFSGPTGSLQVEHADDHLFITPLTIQPADLVVIDTQGQSYKLKFVFDKGVDERIDISSLEKRKESNGDGETVVVEVLKCLLTNRTPAGAQEETMDKVVFDNKQVRMTLVYSYEMPHLIGYVMVVENLLNQSIAVPVQEISFPNLLAVTSEKDLLEKKGSKNALSKVFLVVGR